jgi:hypothetical protein
MLSHRLYYCHEVETFLKFGPCAFLLSRIASILRIFEQKLEKDGAKVLVWDIFPIRETSFNFVSQNLLGFRLSIL